MIQDQQARDRALIIEQSFIVQAPAGSGKTHLLIQRYLALLAKVEQAPEQIIAITFTKKAAAEMRFRILNSLMAATGPQPEAAHAQITWRLARAALARDQAMGWDILANPNRLNVQTIDALCASIVHQMPIVSSFGARPGISEDSKADYQLAAQRLVASVESNVPWHSAIMCLLKHLGNTHSLAEKLIASLLAKREQWLEAVVSCPKDKQLRDLLEAYLVEIVGNNIKTVQRCLPNDKWISLLPLIQFAAKHIPVSTSYTALAAWANQECLPQAEITAIVYWQGIAELLLTKENQWRRQVNKRVGFPAASDAPDVVSKKQYKQIKQDMLAYLQELNSHPECLEALVELKQSPPLNYNDNQWEVLNALLELLPVAAAQLQVVFKEKGKIDFTGMALGALNALGDADNPSDLALALDYRIQHILVDEFQDTSYTQFKLLEKLTAGWQKHDQRTLFLVGDPMQSIYRFRQAEVGLFLRAKQYGIGNIKLDSLTLTVNFRSQHSIVEWINTTFNQIFPDQENRAQGAVPYSPSVAYHGDSDAKINFHPLADEPSVEAHKIIQIIQSTRTENKTASIAILVRARTHLHDILPALKQANISYQAIEIEQLTKRSVINDLLALSCGLLHLGDRIAWLAILRAPWCGLDLHDLFHLTQGDDALIWEHINNPERLSALTPSGQVKLRRFIQAIQPSIYAYQRHHLVDLVKGTWLALGGPACLTSQQSLADATSYFQLLVNLQQQALNIDRPCLEYHVAQLFAPSKQHCNDDIQVMTMHKAKGLEFDVVIIPGLGRIAMKDSPPLLAWMQQMSNDQKMRLLFAPMHAAFNENEPIYDYILRQEKIKAEYELARLFYVATTRARCQLHLLGSIKTSTSEQPNKNAPKGSLLAVLWKQVAEHFNHMSSELSLLNQQVKKPANVLKCLPANWQMPSSIMTLMNADSKHPHAKQYDNKITQYHWQPQHQTKTGTMIHRILAQIADQGLALWNNARVTAMQHSWSCQLIELGIRHSDLSLALKQVTQAIQFTLQDSKGQWMLQPHQDAHCEYALTYYENGQYKESIIDRTFIDQNNIRWIIDYKSSQLIEDDKVDVFLHQQIKYYEPQLRHYAKLFSAYEDRNIMLGLYFPLAQQWCEWPATCEV